MRRFFASLAVIASLYSLPAQAMLEDYPSVKLQGLDKSVGRTVTFEAKVGSTIQYGPLFIKIQSCRKAPPIEKPESAAFLQIWEVPPGQKESEWVFSGWMFASSPALSAMDHPVYDVWVLTCTGREEAEPETVEEAPSDGAATIDAAPSVDVDATTDTLPVDSEAEPGQQAEEAVPATPMKQVPDSNTPINGQQQPAVNDVYTPEMAPVPEGAYDPDGGAAIRTAPPDTAVPSAPASGARRGTPGTAYELMDAPNGRHTPPAVSRQDRSTAYDYMR